MVVQPPLQRCGGPGAACQSPIVHHASCSCGVMIWKDKDTFPASGCQSDRSLGQCSQSVQTPQTPPTPQKLRLAAGQGRAHSQCRPGIRFQRHTFHMWVQARALQKCPSNHAQSPAFAISHADAGKGNVAIWGTQPESIDRAEDRDQWFDLLTSLDIKQPPGAMVTSEKEAVAVADRLGYPVMVRPSFVLGGRAMEIVYG